MRFTRWGHFRLVPEELSVFHLSGFLIGAIGITMALWAFYLIGRKPYHHGTWNRTLALLCVFFIAFYMLSFAGLLWPSISI